MIRLKLRHICIFVFLLSESLAFAQCRLKGDTKLEELGWTACAVGDVNAFGGVRLAGPLRGDFVGAVGDIYTGFYLGSRFSLHSKSYAKEVRTYIPEEKRFEDSNSRVTEQLYLQTGHLMLDPLTLAAGRMPTPFGLNHEVSRYQLPTRAKVFWDRSVNGLRLSWRARDDLRVEIGGAWTERRDIASEEAEAINVRVTQHLDLLSGAKLIASYQNHGKREFGKLGVAALVFYRNNMSSLEWVRVAESLSDLTYEQVFRFVHEERNETFPWNFAFEERRRDSYRIYGGPMWHITDAFNLGTALQYEQIRREDRRDQWWVTLTANYSMTYQTARTRGVE